jgi:iron only hydrogenase large subunit-like protein
MYIHRPDQIHHISVMPCYDKKLEASRQDFYNEIYSTRDVDCVITTGELEVMMRERDWDLSVPIQGELDHPPDSALPELITHHGTSSGSYLHSLMASISTSSTTSLDLTSRTVRTADYEEYNLVDRKTGDILFKGAKCYGFRNLQNVVRKLGREAGIQVGRGAAGKLSRGLLGKRKAARDNETTKGYDYVEIMACPGGCVNGGGQLKPPIRHMEDKEGYERNWEESGVKVPDSGEGEVMLRNAKWGDKEWTRVVEKAYWHNLPPLALAPGAFRSKADDLAGRVLADLCSPTSVSEEVCWGSKMDDAAEVRRRRLFRTNYRAIESDVVGLAVKW